MCYADIYCLILSIVGGMSFNSKHLFYATKNKVNSHDICLAAASSSLYFGKGEKIPILTLFEGVESVQHPFLT